MVDGWSKMEFKTVPKHHSIYSYLPSHYTKTDVRRPHTYIYYILHAHPLFSLALLSVHRLNFFRERGKNDMSTKESVDTQDRNL